MNNSKGFSLIEVLMVVVILAILTAIALPSYQNYVTKSKIKEAQSNLIALSLSVEQIYQRNLTYPIETLSTTDTVKNQFSTWSPTSNNFKYQYTSSNGSEYSIKAIGEDTPLLTCSIELTHQGQGPISGCGHVTTWVN